MTSDIATNAHDPSDFGLANYRRQTLRNAGRNTGRSLIIIKEWFGAAKRLERDFSSRKTDVRAKATSWRIVCASSLIFFTHTEEACQKLPAISHSRLNFLSGFCLKTAAIYYGILILTNQH